MDAFHETMAMPKAEVDRLEKLCRRPAPGLKRDEAVFDRVIRFDDGNQMAIQVIACSEPDTGSCWTQGVLFDADGAELGCTEPGDTFAGEYCAETDDAIYTVVVTCDDRATLLAEVAAALDSLANVCGNVNDDEAEKEAARAADMAMRVRALARELTGEGRWRILSDTETDEDSGKPLEWSNEGGWVTPGDGDVFSDSERDAVSSPLGGRWEPA